MLHQVPNIQGCEAKDDTRQNKSGAHKKFAYIYFSASQKLKTGLPLLEYI
jgi:hypothetical protein